MKKLVILFAALSIIAASCKKDEADPREKFVGTWKGTQTMSVPGLSYNGSGEIVNIITVSSAVSDRILITAGDDIMNATVNGYSYVYEQKTYIENVQGTTATTTMNGSGSINGNTITESGTVVLSIYGQSYNGTWSCTMRRQ